MLSNIQATSQIYWMAALVVALIDIVVFGLLVWLLKESAFHRSKT